MARVTLEAVNKIYDTRRGEVHAVRDLSLAVEDGDSPAETLDISPYELLNVEAENSPAGANGLIFVYFAWGKKLEALATLATIAAGALAYHWFRERGD